ncbi:DMT family transporter [Gryllotalpicola ginsengisoli]|uniref:DMT family transporter n=1 Tax=Gryllotalpicola ginsengisoli TaxID=444608 RepID=UPI0003B3E311|nr:DMT family transporter [Gryllotalpicola ginsengisoli]
MTTGRTTQTGNARGTVWAFLALSTAWGASFLFIKVGLTGLSPAQVVVGRIVLGAAALAAIMLVTRRPWPRELKLWGHMLVVGALFCVVPFTLYAWAELRVPSSLASIYNASTPIMTLLLTPLLLRRERLSGRQLAGLLVGMAGVLVLVAPWQLAGSSALAGTLPAQLACLGATVCYGIAGLYMRRFLTGLPYDSTTLSTVQMVVAALLTLVLAPFDARGPVSLDLPVVAAVVALGVLGTGISYIWYTKIVRDWGPARASTVTYLSPVVGVVLGVLVLGESMHWNEPLGGLIIIAGILASQGGVRMPRRAAQAEETRLT